jgi:hypothetical protein
MDNNPILSEEKIKEIIKEFVRLNNEECKKRIKTQTILIDIVLEKCRIL